MLYVTASNINLITAYIGSMVKANRIVI